MVNAVIRLPWNSQLPSCRLAGFHCHRLCQLGLDGLDVVAKAGGLALAAYSPGVATCTSTPCLRRSGAAHELLSPVTGRMAGPALSVQ